MKTESPEITSLLKLASKLGTSIKVYAVLYHDGMAHCECEDECCGQEATELVAVRFTKVGAENYIRWERKQYHDESDHEIKEIEIK